MMTGVPRDASVARDPDRWLSIVAVVLVHAALGWALLAGLHVDVTHPVELITRMVEVELPPPPPPPPSPPPVKQARPSRAAAAPAAPDRPGGSTGPAPKPRPAPVAPIVVKPPTPAGGGSAGHDTAAGLGSGGGTGGTGTGTGNGDGGTDLEQIAGEFRPSDYPKAAFRAGIGGRVEFRFTVLANGRVGACAITRSSGNAELDAATCRVIIERFRYRPSTDSSGRPIADEVEGDQLWTINRHDSEE